MKRFISYPHIGQFRNVISTIKHTATYFGDDENGEAIYRSVELPSITFSGTTKLHGTNGSVAYNATDGLWAQSRKNIITIEKDNHGFAFFVESNKEALQKLIDIVVERENIDTKTQNVVIFGEWCGGNIQNGVSISGLDKMLVIFNVKISPFEQNDDGTQDDPSYWVDHKGLSDNDNNIYNIEDFESFSVDIDFNRPELSQNKFVDIVKAVEEECPVGKVFGRKLGEDNTIGEGVVWKGWYEGTQLMFKTKGDKHAGKGSKPKVIAPVDVELMNTIHEFVEYAVSEERLNQSIEMVFTQEGKTPDIKGMGDFIKWIVSDISREEIDTMKENDLEPKKVNKFISMRCRNWFNDFLNKQAGL